jgi:Tfp pilus assembly protein PilW
MLARMNRRLRAHRDDDAGIGLIEILVASMIGLILLAAVGAAFIQTGKVTNLTIQNRSSTGNASNAMTEISEVIRLATPIVVAGQQTATAAVVSGTATKLVIYSLVDVTDPSNPAPSKVTLDTTSGSLVDTRCLGTLVNGFWTFTTCATTISRNIAGTFVAPGTGQNPLFTYQSASGAAITLTGLPAALPSTQATLSSVASILVGVNLQAPGAKTNPVYLESKIGMPNVGLQVEAP